ncbi:hypothetical protein QA942_19980 [Streptomyces sp. B21-106]|jgi:hypothetical protein|uniref:hypothetical protein n=1 Tax=Streptomyces sp. B21-106 TaxID=3039418 RepID=UPI002FF37BCB
MRRKAQVQKDLTAWRELAQQHMPGWRPTLQQLQRLDEGPHELGVALRSIARDWDRDDARWDVLMAVLEYYKREHAHSLANQQREHVRRRAAHPLHYGSADWAIRGVDEAADLIDPKAQRASTEGDNT